MRTRQKFNIYLERFFVDDDISLIIAFNQVGAISSYLRKAKLPPKIGLIALEPIMTNKKTLLHYFCLRFQIDFHIAI